MRIYLRCMKVVGMAAAFLFALTLNVIAQQSWNPGKVAVCHNGNTIFVDQNALSSHEAHGDTRGPCGSGCYDASLIDPNLFCLAVYDPVCGCDGITYSNACVATVQNGITSFIPGECGCINPFSPLIGNFCPLFFDPVCGCNGETYSNSCFAAAAGVTSWEPGACKPIIISPSKNGGVADNMTGLALDAYPNPAASNPTLRFLIDQDQDVQLLVMNMEGAVVAVPYKGKAEAGKLYEVTLNTEGFAAGMYLFKLNGTINSLPAQKLIVIK